MFKISREKIKEKKNPTEEIRESEKKNHRKWKKHGTPKEIQVISVHNKFQVPLECSLHKSIFCVFFTDVSPACRRVPCTYKYCVLNKQYFNEGRLTHIYNCFITHPLKSLHSN